MYLDELVMGVEEIGFVVSWRGRLPHYFVGGYSHFFTLRVADSIPRAEIPRSLQLANALRNLEPLSPEFEVLQRKQFAVVEKLMHQGHGFTPFSQPTTVDAMHASMELLSDQVMPLRRWVVMPNHLHWLTEPLDPSLIAGLRSQLGAWKGRTAYQMNRILNRNGAFWQREWYDHWIRDSTKVDAILRYMVANPNKAGISDLVDAIPRVGPMV